MEIIIACFVAVAFIFSAVVLRNQNKRRSLSQIILEFDKPPCTKRFNKPESIAGFYLSTELTVNRAGKNALAALPVTNPKHMNVGNAEDISVFPPN